MTRFLFVFLLLISTSVFAAEEPELPGFGIWSWSQKNFETRDARQSLLDFCVAEKIVHIDQHLSISKTKDGDVVKNTEALQRLLLSACSQGISVNALRGERTMFFAENHNRVLDQLRVIVRFNNSLPKDARFAGIKYDVEPYLTPEWRAGGDSRARVIADYLTFLKKAQTLIDEETENFALSVDIPFWWDKPEFASNFSGKEQLLIHHIIDLTDWIGIMSYRRGSVDVIRLTNEEFAYANQLNKRRSIAPGVNTAAEKGSEHWTSFDGVPVANFRKTLEELQSELSENEATRLIMIHDYKSLVKYLKTE